MVINFRGLVETDLVTERTHAKIMRETLREAMTHYQQTNIAKHFEIGAGKRYGYAKRSRLYMLRKARLKGHQIPLVFSGQMRREVRANSKVRATQHRSTLTMRNYFPMKVELRRELESVSDEERREFVEFIKQKYVEKANLPENRRKRRSRRK